MRLGFHIKIFGSVDEYKGKLEIIPESCEIIERETIVPISSLERHMGGKVTVEAAVERIFVSTKNTVFLTIRDVTGSVDVVFFADVAGTIMGVYSLKSGEKVRGRVSSYEGKIEIIGEGYELIQSSSLRTCAMQSPMRHASSDKLFPWSFLRR